MTDRDDPKKKKALKRYQEVRDILDGDDIGEKCLEDLVDSSSNYVKNVLNLEHAIKTSRFHGDDPEKYKSMMENLDRNRRISHNALLSNFKILNRYLFRKLSETDKRLPGGIYTENPDNLISFSRYSDMNDVPDRIRYSVAEWAGYLLDGVKLAKFSDFYDTYERFSDKIPTFQTEEEREGLRDFLEEIYSGSLTLAFGDRFRKNVSNKEVIIDDVSFYASRLNQISEELDYGLEFDLGGSYAETEEILVGFIMESYHRRKR